MAPNFCAGAYPLRKMAKALPTRGDGWPRVLRAYKTPISAKSQTLKHSPAHVERHAGQETPIHYTPYSGTILVGERYCHWLKPPLRSTTPTRTLYWVALKMKTRAPAAHL